MIKTIPTIREPAEQQSTADDALGKAGDGIVTLELADLIQDSNGEIVLFNDSHLPALALRTDAQPVAQGEVAKHVTAGGEDVSGYHFVSFSNGLTVFFHDNTELLILSGADI